MRRAEALSRDPYSRPPPEFYSRRGRGGMAAAKKDTLNGDSLFGAGNAAAGETAADLLYGASSSRPA